MAGNQNQQKQIKQGTANVLEALKDIGAATGQSLKEDLLKKAPQDFMDQMFGPMPQSHTGEIIPGEAVEFNEVFSGQHDENQRLRKQVVLERNLRREEEARIDTKTGQLRMQLKVLMDEVIVLTDKTQSLSQEVQTAAMQAPIEPGIYHVFFFDKLLEFLKSFSKKIEEASIWLHATNKRAQKKNFWDKYKKHGGSFLLSGEHYSQRSAG
jgi:hypothetical protein